MKASKEMYVTICTDDEEKMQDKDTDIFYSNKITMNKLIKIAEANNIEIGKPIVLSKTHRFKSKELTHLEGNIYKNLYKKYLDENKDINLFLSANPYSEIEYVASKIIENVRENRI